MNTIKKDELFQNLSSFLKSKGVELKAGSYSHRIEQGCGLLADVVNATQRAAKRAKSGVNKKLGQLRQSIHDATAPDLEVAKPPSANRRKAKATSRRASASRTKPGPRK